MARLISQCKEHIHLLDFIENDQIEDAAILLRDHLDIVGKLKTSQRSVLIR